MACGCSKGSTAREQKGTRRDAGSKGSSKTPPPRTTADYGDPGFVWNGPARPAARTA